MTTPIWDFVRSYTAGEPVRMHMPGHKGRPLLGPESLDITEISGADVLYHADGIIRQSRQNAADLFGSGATFYSAEGSSLAIRAMLYLAMSEVQSQGRRPVIAAGRNAHKVFITAAALLDAEVAWLWPEYGSYVSCDISPDRLESFLAGLPEPPAAVYVTSPDYLGNIADIAGLARVCHAHGCLLLVDNAHGAYLNFLSPSRHPMALGADLCCDSAHKTLPALTGAAYLHISRTAAPVFAPQAEQALALFASTSPSYLILESLDLCNAWLSDGFSQKLAKAVLVWDALKARLQAAGFTLIGSEPLKLTIQAKLLGYTGTELSDILERQGIFSEFADPDYLVWMLPAEYPPELPGLLENALLSLPRRMPILSCPPVPGAAAQVISPRQALFLPSEEIPVECAAGRTAAAPTVSCPPAVPIVSCGERIEPWAVEAMRCYHIGTVRVVCE